MKVTDIPPLRRQVLVASEPQEAFRHFVDDIGRWWPLETFGCFESGSTVRLDGDRFVETSSSGEAAVWGTLTEMAAPEAATFTWHPGRAPEVATLVRVTFAPASRRAATLVTLEHTGWEAYPDPVAARAHYAGGWVTVLGRYTDAAPTPDGDADAAYWFVLEHRAGRATPPEGVFESPLFAEHLAFVAWLRDQGVLVAGGSLPDQAGAGMTVVKAHGLVQARRVVAAAQLDDRAVTAGLLDVRVRPWQVAMSA